VALSSNEPQIVAVLNGGVWHPRGSTQSSFRSNQEVIHSVPRIVALITVRANIYRQTLGYIDFYAAQAKAEFEQLCLNFFINLYMWVT